MIHCRFLSHLALDSLGFGEYMNDCKSALEECKTVAAKKRRGSNRLENLGIPEEELLRQQQELFEKVWFVVTCKTSHLSLSNIHIYSI